jgi:hypothetical protein
MNSTPPDCSRTALFETVNVTALRHVDMTASSLRRKTENQAGRAMTEIASQIFESAPAQMRQRPPIPKTIQDLRTRVEYFEYWASRASYALSQCQSEDEARFWIRFKRTQQRKLKAALVSLSVGHYCECCGRLLTKTPGPIGPECSGHPNSFPCRSRRGRTHQDFSDGWRLRDAV